MICTKKKSRGHEELWRFRAGYRLYLCLMRYTDQSGIRLLQHLTRCALLYELWSIRITNINNTHLCDLTVVLHKEKKQKGSAKQAVFISLFFAQNMLFGKKMSVTLFHVNYLLHVLVLDCPLTQKSRLLRPQPNFLFQIKVVYIAILLLLTTAHFASANVITDNAVSLQRYFLNFQSHKWDVISHFTIKVVLCGVLYSKNLCLCMVESGIL